MYLGINLLNNIITQIIVFFNRTVSNSLLNISTVTYYGQAEKPVRFSFCPNIFFRWLAFSIFAPWKKAEVKNIFAIIYEIVPKRYMRIVVVVRVRNFRKSAKSRFCFCFNKWTENIWRFFWTRLNFTPPKFRISERFF